MADQENVTKVERYLSIGLVQMAMEESVEANRNTAAEMITNAAQLGAEIVCLPELFTSPYFCNIALSSDHDPRERYAETIPGPTSNFLAKMAKALRITIVGGSFYEKATDPKSGATIYYNTALTFDPSGKLISTYRKMHIPHDEGFFEQHYFAPGDLGYQSATIAQGKVGTLICFDQWFPEAARLTMLAGAEVIFYPTAIGTVDGVPEQEGSWQEARENVMRGHAIANSVVTCGVNRVGKEGRSNFWGGSFICDAFGRTISKAGDQEQILVHQVDLEHGVFIADSWRFRPNRRPDSYVGLTTPKGAIPTAHKTPPDNAH